MIFLRLLFWPVVLLPALFWAWQSLHEPPPASVLPDGARLQWGECWFEHPWWRPVHCGHLTTAPEPGATPPSFDLPVVYIPQYFWRREGPPTLYIAGGPGGSAWLGDGDMDFWLDWADQAGWPGDLVLYDQRGVGLSQPKLECPELQALRRELLPLPLPTEEAYRRVREATRACHDRLRAEGIDLARFTTRNNAADAIDLMRSMGLAHWNLYGVSYGTRVALEVLRQDSAQVHAAVLDSPYPPQVNPELADAWLLQRSFELFGRICDLVEDCGQTSAELDALLEKAFARVEREKIRLSVPDPVSGQDLAVVYDQDDLAWLLFEAMYQWEALPGLPDSVRALADGRLDSAMRSLIRDSVDTLLDNSVSDAVASSVDCHDAGAVDLREAKRELVRYPRAAPVKRFDWQYHVCRYWASGEADPDFRTAVQSDVPTLILVGEFDPVTPPEWAGVAAEGLSHASVFVFPAVGHGVLDSHVCASDLVRAFLDRPQAPRPPACLERL
ncbi:MAG: alpha/beta hydrolase [Chromatiaceae bacterium]|nr:alpha/beta hydrolase [Chromatiaceae bacterium]MCP5422218.1 alpha/beta hydrolase [Chromatiaceae bacterium]